jgi:hypothetical protein
MTCKRGGNFIPFIRKPCLLLTACTIGKPIVSSIRYYLPSPVIGRPWFKSWHERDGLVLGKTIPGLVTLVPPCSIQVLPKRPSCTASKHTHHFPSYLPESSAAYLTHNSPEANQSSVLSEIFYLHLLKARYMLQCWVHRYLFHIILRTATQIRQPTVVITSVLQL